MPSQFSIFVVNLFVQWEPVVFLLSVKHNNKEYEQKEWKRESSDLYHVKAALLSEGDTKGGATFEGLELGKKKEESSEGGSQRYFCKFKIMKWKIAEEKPETEINFQ